MTQNNSLSILNAPEFVVFDTETTALVSNLAYGKIIEIGAVKVVNNEIVDTFSTFINPEMKIPKKIMELTGITDEMVKDAPTIYPVINDFREWCGNAVLVAHNAPFDIRFITFYSSQICKPFNTHKKIVDTLKLDKAMFPNSENHKLGTIAKRFGIVQEAAHRAVDDARVTALAFIEMRKLLENRIKGLEFTYECSKHVVNISNLKYRRISDFKKEASKTRGEIDRLYVNLYYPDEQVYGTIFYDRIAKAWYNKDLPSHYEVDFEELEKEILIIRKGEL